MATEKTANDYREERKARLAKASKKNSTKAHKLNGPRVSGKVKAIIGSVFGVAVAVAIAVTACINLGVFERFKKITTATGESYSYVEYEYYYAYIHSQVYSMTKQYDEYYGEGYGFYATGYDYNKLPEDQEYSGSDYKLDDGSKPTFKQYFEHYALQMLQQNTILANKAKAAGFKVSDAVQAESDAQIQSMRDSIKEEASSNNGQISSLGRRLRLIYGKGMSEDMFKKIVDKQTLATEYATKYADEIANKYTDAQLETEYKKDTSAYNYVDLRLFTVSPETSELDENATEAESTAATKAAADAAKKKADEMFGKITDEASFKKLAAQYATADQKASVDYADDTATLSKYVSKSTLTDSMGLSEDAVKWVFDAGTKAGSKKMFTIDNNGSSVYVMLYMVKTSYRDDATIPVDVRHILFQFDESATDAKADAEKQKSYADDALKQIKASSDPLETFISICKEKSADTNSKENGGLMSKVARGQYVKEFEEWSLDAARKEGDCAVIKTDYGYHVMYFVKKYTKPMWKLTISETLAQDAIQTELEKLSATDQYAVKDTAKLATWNAESYKLLMDSYYAGITAADESTTA